MPGKELSGRRVPAGRSSVRLGRNSSTVAFTDRVAVSLVERRLLCAHVCAHQHHTLPVFGGHVAFDDCIITSEVRVLVPII